MKSSNKSRFKIMEFMSSLETLYIGAVLSIPSDTFAISRAYNSMSAVASEETWAWIFLAVFAIQLLGILMNNRAMRLVGLLIAIGLFFAMGSMFLMSSPDSTAWGTYLWFGVFNCILYWKVGVDRDA